MTLHLPDVTVVAIDCKAHDLTRMALEDTLSRIAPGDVQFWSDRPLISEGSWHKCDLQSYRAVAAMLWNVVPFKVTTSHILLIQWDGWVIDPEVWDWRWMDCDYIGAPWWYESRNVGNGGFSLRSRDLMKWMSGHSKEFPIRDPEDETLCRSYRPRLEEQGFKWATQRLARRFSFETAYAAPTFGFHSIYNWHRFLSLEAFENRMSLANDYIRSKVEWPMAVNQLAQMRVAA